MGFLVFIALIYVLTSFASDEPGIAVMFMIFMLVSLAWMLPMTLRAHKAYTEVGTDQEKQHMALAICTLLSTGLISGILFIVATVSFADAKERSKNENIQNNQNTIIE